MREQAGGRAAFVALLIGWGILAAPWLSGRYTIPWDAKAHFLPQLQFLGSSLARGDSPFWSPYVFAGHPQIADPQSLIFSPPFLLLAAFDPAPTAWAADTALFTFILVSATALLLWTHDRGWHPAAGAMSALSFAFGAAMAWRIQHVGQVMSLAYLPIVLLCLDRALERSSWLYGAAAGAMAALLVLGRDQVALLCVYFLVGYVVWRIWEAPVRVTALRRAVRPVSAATFTGLVIVAIPALLTVLMAAQSNRPAIDLDGAGRGSLHPALFLTALAPDVFGSSGRMGEYWGPPSFHWPDTGLYIAQNMGQLYFGALPALLLIAGAVNGLVFAPPLRFFFAALLATSLYALGWYTPVFGWMHALVPGVDLFRRPADGVFLIGLLASVISGGVLHALLAQPDALPVRTLCFVATFLVVAFAVMLGLAVRFGQLNACWPAIAIPAGLFAASAAALLLLCTRPDLSHASAIALVAALLVADLAWSNGPGGATALPPATFDVLDPDTPNATIALLKTKTAQGNSDTRRDRVEIVGFGFHWPNASLTHGLENTLGYNPLRLALYTRATGAGDHVGLVDQKGFSPLFPSYRSTLSDLLGLRYVAASAPIETFDKRLAPGEMTLIARTADGYVYENPRAMPRVLFATSARDADFEDILKTGIWPETDLSETVLLEGGADEHRKRPGQVHLASYRNTSVAIDVNSPDGGYVVLNDPWQSWWFAAVDGRDTPLLRANVLFRAVAVPAGRHTVEFTFAPLRGAWREIFGGS